MKSASRRAATDPQPVAGRRRRFNFGPGIAIALTLAGFLLYQEWARRGRDAPPGVERTVVGDPTVRDEGIVGELSFLLEKREQVRLSAQQVKEVEKLLAEWRRVSAPLREQVDREAEEFRSWMDEAQRGGRVAVSDIQRESAEVSALSSELARRRRDYWDRALELLTDDQRSQVEKERKKG